MTDGKIDNQSEDIIEGRHERSSGQCRINFETVQSHGYPCSEETRKNDYAEKGDGCSEAEVIFKVKEHAHSEDDERANQSIE